MNYIKSKYYIFTTRKTDASRAFIVVLFILGIIHLFTHIIFGISVFTIALFLAISRDGIIVDLKNKRYKTARIIGNFGFSKWKHFPDFKYISVFNTLVVTRSCSISGIYVSIKKKVIKVNLIYDKNKKLTVYQDYDIDSVYKKAKYFAKELELKIYDATNKEWM